MDKEIEELKRALLEKDKQIEAQKKTIEVLRAGHDATRMDALFSGRNCALEKIRSLVKDVKQKDIKDPAKIQEVIAEITDIVEKLDQEEEERNLAVAGAMSKIGFNSSGLPRQVMSLPDVDSLSSPDAIADAIEKEHRIRDFVLQYLDLVRIARSLYEENGILLGTCREMEEKIGTIRELLQSQQE